MTTHPASVALPDPQRATPLECPRCGYDQSAIPPTWTGQCPIEGQCSECGLVYPWRDIYDPVRGIPRWSFEHANRSRVLLAFFGTLWRAFKPWQYWSSVRLTWPFRWPRLVICFLLMFCLNWLVLGLLTQASDRSYTYYMEYQQHYNAGHVFGVSRTITVQSNWHGTRVLSVPSLMDFLSGDLFGNWSRSRATLHSVIQYPLPDINLLWIDWHTVPSFVLLVAILIVMPFCHLPLRITYTRARLRFRHALRSGLVIGIMTLCFWLCVRAGIYVAEIVTSALGTAQIYRSMRASDWMHAYLLAAFFAWIILNWTCVCRQHFRIRHGFACALLSLILALAVIAFLAGCLEWGAVWFL